MSSLEETEKKKANPILWILFAVVIPLFIVGVIILVILNLAGVNVGDWAREQGNNIPVISNFVSSKEEMQTEEDMERLIEDLKIKDEELEELNRYVDDLEATISDLEQELSHQEQIVSRYEDSSQADDEEDARSLNEQIEDEPLRDVALSFEEMKPANAATILGSMNDNDILRLLKELPNDVRGDILEAMEAELAASITTQLME